MASSNEFEDQTRTILDSLLHLEQVKEQQHERVAQMVCDEAKQHSSNDKDDVSDELEKDNTDDKYSEENEAALQKVTKELQQIRIDNENMEKELSKFTDVLAKDMAECEELEKLVEESEKPVSEAWIRMLQQELKPKSNYNTLQRATNKLLTVEMPLLEKEFQQINESQNKFIASSDKEICDLQAQLRDLQNKEERLKSDISAGRVTREISESSIKKMKTIIRQHQKEKKYLQPIQEKEKRMKRKTSSLVNKVTTKAEQLCEELDEMEASKQD